MGIIGFGGGYLPVFSLRAYIPLSPASSTISQQQTKASASDKLVHGPLYLCTSTVNGRGRGGRERLERPLVETTPHPSPYRTRICNPVFVRRYATIYLSLDANNLIPQYLVRRHLSDHGWSTNTSIAKAISSSLSCFSGMRTLQGQKSPMRHCP